MCRYLYVVGKYISNIFTYREEKFMKDYALVRHVFKLTGSKVTKDKEVLNCEFPYGDRSNITVLAFFKKRQSHSVLFQLEDVYNEYASHKFASYEQFADVFTDKYTYFGLWTSEEGSMFVSCDFEKSKIPHTASMVLAVLTILIGDLNEFLGMDSQNFDEEDWRNLHRDLLSKQKRNFGLGIGGGILLTVLGAVMLFTLQGEGVGPFLAGILGLIFIPAGIVGAIYCGFMFKAKDRHLKKSIKSKKFGE